MAESEREKRIRERREAARAKAWREYNTTAEAAAADLEAVIGTELGIYMTATSAATGLLTRTSGLVERTMNRLIDPAIAALEIAMIDAAKVREEIMPPVTQAYEIAVTQASNQWKTALNAAETLFADQLGAARRLREAEVAEANNLH